MAAYNFALDYRFPSVLGGTLSMAALATRNVTNKQDLLPGVPGLDLAGTSQVVKWAGNANATYERGQWSAAWTVRHVGSYFFTAARNVMATSGSATAPSQTYHDLSLAYDFRNAASSLLANMQVRLNVNNVFNREPPFVGFSPYYSGAGDPRLATYTLSARKAFN